MQQIQVQASQEHCWKLISQPEYWHKWAPWLPLGLDNRPKRGSRVRSRFLHLPLPGKITAWQPDWRWDWRWGTVTWRHQIDRVDDHTSLLTIQLFGPGSSLVELFYAPLMGLALRRFARLAAQG